MFSSGLPDYTCISSSLLQNTYAELKPHVQELINKHTRGSNPRTVGMYIKNTQFNFRKRKRERFLLV